MTDYPLPVICSPDYQSAFDELSFSIEELQAENAKLKAELGVEISDKVKLDNNWLIAYNDLKQQLDAANLALVQARSLLEQVNHFDDYINCTDPDNGAVEPEYCCYLQFEFLKEVKDILSTSPKPTLQDGEGAE